MGDLVRHASEQEALRSRHALVADHDQIGLRLLGDVEDRVGRVALAGMRLSLDVLLPRLARRAVEHQANVLTWVDGVPDVAGELGRLVAQALLGDRREGADDVQLGPGHLRQLDRLADGVRRRLRPVGANHDAAEHSRLLRSGTRPYYPAAGGPSI